MSRVTHAPFIPAVEMFAFTELEPAPAFINVQRQAHGVVQVIVRKRGEADSTLGSTASIDLPQKETAKLIDALRKLID